MLGVNLGGCYILLYIYRIRTSAGSAAKTATDRIIPNAAIRGRDTAMILLFITAGILGIRIQLLP